MSIKQRIERRAAEIKRAREAGEGFWARVRRWLAGVDEEAERKAAERARLFADAQSRANAAFPARLGRAPGWPDAGLSAGYRPNGNRGFLRHRSRDDYEQHIQE